MLPWLLFGVFLLVLMWIFLAWSGPAPYRQAFETHIMPPTETYICFNPLIKSDGVLSVESGPIDSITPLLMTPMAINFDLANAMDMS